MSRRNKTAIGSVLCAHRECSEHADIYRYAERAKSAAARRFAGRLYAVCPAGHRCEDQRYLSRALTGQEAPEGHGETAEPGIDAEKQRRALVNEVNQGVAAAALGALAEAELERSRKRKANAEDTTPAKVVPAKKWGFF